MKPMFKISTALSSAFGMALLALLAACSGHEAPKETSRTFVLSDTMFKTTTTEPAKNEPLRNELSFYGKITADNNRMIEIFPVVGGNVISVNVELGDYVTKGTLLASIRSTEVANFEQELTDAKNQVIVAKNNLKVAQDLFDGKLNTERDVLEAKSMLERAQSQLKRMQETYSIYHLKAGSIYEVRAPISGFIIEKDINQDMLLRNDRTDNIFDIAEINEVWAIANVNESEINQIKLGADAGVRTLSYPDKVFTGKVDKIFNIIDQETKAMKVRVKLPNENYALKPEMRATVKISYQEDQTMLTVPTKAIIFDKSKNFVMVYKNRNTIETRQVEVFRQVNETSYISAGLKPGEKVITTNQLYIYDALND